MQEKFVGKNTGLNLDDQNTPYSAYME